MLMSIAIAVVLIAVVVLATWFLRKQRLDVWQHWAQSKGLTYLAPPAGPKITGRIGDQQITVESHNHGSDAEGPVEIVRCCVTINGLGLSLDVEGIPGLIGDLAQLGEDRFHTGDEEFDRDVVVRAHGDESALREYWTAPRRSAFRKLVNEAPCDQVLIEGQTLIGEERSIISTQQHLDELARALLMVAESLDVRKDS